MVRGSGDFGLALKLREAVVISGEYASQDLDRDRTLQLRIDVRYNLALPDVPNFVGDRNAERGAKETQNLA